MDIEVERGAKVYNTKPESVYVRLIGNNGEVKGFIAVFPKVALASANDDTFHIEVVKGFNPLNTEISIKLDI